MRYIPNEGFSTGIETPLSWVWHLCPFPSLKIMHEGKNKTRCSRTLLECFCRGLYFSSDGNVKKHTFWKMLLVEIKRNCPPVSWRVTHTHTEGDWLGGSGRWFCTHRQQNKTSSLVSYAVLCAVLNVKVMRYRTSLQNHWAGYWRQNSKQAGEWAQFIQEMLIYLSLFYSSGCQAKTVPSKNRPI